MDQHLIYGVHWQEQEGDDLFSIKKWNQDFYVKIYPKGKGSGENLRKYGSKFETFQASAEIKWFIKRNNV